MTQSDFVSQFLSFLSLFLSGMTVSFSVVSAYIAALYYFLHKAEFFIKLMSFLFFTGILICLGLFAYESTEFYKSFVAIGWSIDNAPDKAIHITGILSIISNTIDKNYIYAPLIIGASLYASLLYLTFFHKWKDVHSACPR
jgi:hypothetical protein